MEFKLSFLFFIFGLFYSATFAVLEKAIEELAVVDKLALTSATGPESIAFDASGGGPYTGVSDGRIFKWRGPELGWGEFAAPENRDRLCDGSVDSLLEVKCGRPLGLQFHKATGMLYIADAYFGLLGVGPEGGVAARLAAGADGQPFYFTNGLDVDQVSGKVYFTDSSTLFRRSEFVLAALTGDDTGRLLEYNPISKKVTVLKRGLTFPNGVALSKDNTFLLVAETGSCKILRYWLQGPKAGMLELFADLPGYPDNIKRTPGEEFWVALSQDRLDLHGTSKASGLRQYEWSLEHPVALRLNKDGRVVEVLDGELLTSISEVEEKNGTLWVGSVILPYVAVYKP